VGGGVEKVDGEYLFTFPQMIELLTIASFRALGVSHKDIRHTYAQCEQKYGTNPFARLGFRSDGKHIFTAVGEPTSEDLTTRQLFFEDTLGPILQDVSYDSNIANRFDPMGARNAVVIDSNVAFGSPVDRATGVRTSVLHAMKANDPGESNESIADWYGVAPQAVQDAFDYEEGLLAA
jgi:uncharacterized protein (DUF433 family)